MEQLRNYAIHAGYSCPDWQPRNNPKPGLEAGSCSSHDLFAVYDDPADAARRAALADSVGGYANASWLVGRNWLINTNDFALKSRLAHDIPDAEVHNFG